jgi:iron complex transport system substrate-binding protein
VKGNGITMARIPIRLLLSILALLLVLAACAPSGGAPPSGSASAADPSLAPTASPSPSATATTAAFPVTIADGVGNEVTLESAPERIVSLAPSNTEIVCALGACDRLVGVTDFDDYPPEVAEIDKVVVAATVDVERVVAAEPDLVLAAGNELTPSAVLDQLAELELPVLVLYPESLDEVKTDIELVATALDRRAEADALIADMEVRIDDVTTAVEGAERPATLYEVFHSEGTTYTAGEGSFLASMIELAGGDPVTGDAQGVIGAEDLVAADPQLILLGTASYDPSLGEPEAALESVSSRPGWAELTAVRDGAVVPYLDDIVTTRPGPRIVEGLEALARAIHPDRFD